MAEPIYITHSGGGVSGTAALGSAVSFTGTISGVRVLMPNGNLSGETQTFDIYKNGAAQSVGLLVPDGDNEHTVTGLSIAATDDDTFQFYITAPVADTMPVPPYHFTITLAETHVALTGAQTVAGVKTFSSDPIIPDEAYGVGWNGSLEPPTKNAVYDKIETLGGGGDALTSDGLDQFAATTSLELKGVISDETGSGALVFATSPTLVTPALGTPASGVLTNCTGLPTAGLVDDAVTLAKIQNAAANSKLLGSGDAGSGANYVEITLGTNLSMTGTTLSASLAGGAVDTANSPNAGEWAKFTDADTIEGRTDAEIIGDLSLEIGVDVQAYDAQLDTWAGITPGANVGTFLATPSSANLASAITDETGSGALVFGTAPTISNPKLDLDASAASDDTYSGVTISGRNNSGGVTQWDAVYINGSSEFVIADANGSGTYPAIGLAVATVAGAGATTVLTHGTVRNDAWTWTVGGVIYLSTTAGGLTQTAPSASGDKVQVMGIAISADEMLVMPSLNYITIT